MLGVRSKKEIMNAIKNKSLNFIIRAWEEPDIVNLPKHLSNINIWNNCRDRLPFPYTEKDAEDFVRFATGQTEQSEYCIEINNEAVGNIGFVRGTDIERYNAEIGYWLSEKYWNKGVVTAALKIAIEHYFHHTNVIRLFATIFEHNLASIRVLEKNGFQKTGILHKACFKNDHFVDIHYYELLKGDLIRMVQS